MKIKEKKCNNCKHFNTVSHNCDRFHAHFCNYDNWKEIIPASPTAHLTVYEARENGRKCCLDTQGSDHYKAGNLEPMDLVISKDMSEDFCLGNIIKYATRFKQSQNLNDLKKISDYAHILCGVKLNEEMQ